MTETATVTLAERIKAIGIRMTAEEIDHNPNMANDDWARTANHWRCVLRLGRRQFTVPFSQGSAHTSAPTLESVLDCIASDASGVENARSFEDWAGEYGYDTDSRKAERTYDVCKRQAAKLKQFLGDEAYELILWHTERE